MPQKIGFCHKKLQKRNYKLIKKKAIELPKKQKSHTFQIGEQIIRNIPRGLRPAVTIINSNERPATQQLRPTAARRPRPIQIERPRFNLARILHQIVRLHHRH